MNIFNKIKHIFTNKKRYDENKLLFNYVMNLTVFYLSVRVSSLYDMSNEGTGMKILNQLKQQFDFIISTYSDKLITDDILRQAMLISLENCEKCDVAFHEKELSNMYEEQIKNNINQNVYKN